MKSKKFSFRYRFIFITTLFLVLMAGVAIVTQNKIRETTEANHQDQLHYHEYQTVQKRLFWVLIEFENNIDSYARDPNPEKGHRLIQHVETIYPYVADLKLNEKENEQDKQINALITRLNNNVHEVQQAILMLVSHLNLPEKRFPAMPIMLNEMLPLREDIDLALRLALLEESEQEKNSLRLSIRELFFQLRYIWNQQLNLTRVFISNRSSVFGPPIQGMERSLLQRKEYTHRTNALLQQLQNYDDKDELEFQQSEALAEITGKIAQFDEAFAKTAKIYLSDNWRMDDPLISKQVNPSMAKLWMTMHSIEEYLNKEIVSTQQGGMVIAEKISGLLWFFLFAASVVSLLLYLLFERGIRLPMMRVITAIDSVARGDQQIQLPPANTLETELLITSFGNMREQVRSRQNRLKSILDNTHDGIVTIDEKGSIETLNKAAEQLFGYYATEIIGKNVSLLMPEPDRGQHDGYLKHYCETGKAKVLGKEVERIACRKDGSEFPISIKTSELFLEGKRFFTAITADISERRELMDRLEHLAEHDPLTGLYNRRYFLDELSRIQERIHRGSLQCALLFIDLDNFKYVNDTMGHPAGDKVLLDISELLKQRLRAGDLLARQGGDEFTILLYDINKKEAFDIAEDYRKQIANYQFQAEDQTVDIGGSIGLALMNNAESDSISPLAQADIACHMAKKGGRNRVCIYQPKENQNSESVSSKTGWAERIRQAIDAEQFKIRLNPILEVKSNKLNRHQVEACMLDAEGQEVWISQYEKPAARFGLLKDIEQWLLINAIELLAERLRTEESERFSIHLSYQTVCDDSMLELLKHHLLKHKVPANALIIEFKEDEVVQNLRHMKALMDEFNTLGCMLCVVGIGHGSMQFSYLRYLPVELIRIDAAIIKNLGRSNFTKVLVKSMIDICHALYKNVGAEGVDTAIATELLTDFGIDCIQGTVVTSKD